MCGGGGAVVIAAEGEGGGGGSGGVVVVVGGGGGSDGLGETGASEGVGAERVSFRMKSMYAAISSGFH